MDIKYEIEIYETLRGKRPFELWIDKLKDYQGAAAVKVRFRRAQLGNLGDSKSVGSGVFELRVNFGPGYRVYYGKLADKIILLLCGGNKNSQEKDIKAAKEYLEEFLQRSKGYGKN